MDEDLSDLDAGGLLAAASESVRARRLAEVRELAVVAQWAVVHSGPPTKKWDALLQLGGEGTPKVQEFCLGELAMARGTGVAVLSSVVADTLDLIHRLPRTWARCVGGVAEVHLARRVARLSRHLPADKVGLVDKAVARVIGRESGGRVLSVAEAKVIEADPDLHQERVEAERRRRYVTSSRTDEVGLRTMIARCVAGDVVWVEAMIAQVAEIIAPLHPEATLDELRSIAFGWLARPAELLQLLLEHQEDPDPETTWETAGPADRDPAEAPPYTDEAPPADEAPPGPDEARPCRALAFPADLLDALRSLDLSPLALRAVLYVHLHEATLRGGGGVARVEGLGPVTLAGLRELLARTRLTIKPVIDLSERVRTTAYEHPESLKERVHLTTGGDYWPYAASTGRNLDYDHVTPYDPDQDIRGGPPGQTGTHNSGPLGRRHHRWKTHAGYRTRQCGQGRYLWVTPHGLAYLVDHRGTRQITLGEANLIFDAPPGVDIYPGGDLQLPGEGPEPE